MLMYSSILTYKWITTTTTTITTTTYSILVSATQNHKENPARSKASGYYWLPKLHCHQTRT